MERSVKLAVVMAAAVCLVVGLAWDRLIRTVVDDPHAEAAPGEGEPARVTAPVEFQFVGNLSSPAPAPRGAAPASAPRVVPLPVESPVTQPVAASALSAASDGDGGVRTYTVKRGDRLGTISKQFFGTELRWRDIMQFNGISDPRALREGQKLKIPPLRSRTDSR